ncbi:MAG: hypothetical protein ABMB14_29235 [Myxococcota bacterium]
MDRPNPTVMCPSGTIDEPKARLLGVIAPDGRLRFAEEPIPIDRAFIDLAKRGRNPSRRFRFVTPCIQRACIHWQGERCVVADIVTDAALEASDPEVQVELPRCPIRTTCRWFHQRGADACRACPEMVTDQYIGEPR